MRKVRQMSMRQYWGQFISTLVVNVADMLPTPALSPISERHTKTGNTNVDDVGANYD